ncbi:hypothetical protein BGX29_008432 [Mortierella sp. GBA35]|nr:hypothetical protein BGX29_008432 [Mortierella sp. GBA35]
MQQRLQEQQSSVPELAATANKASLSILKPTGTGAAAATTGLAKPSPIARSTSASALPPSTTMMHNLNLNANTGSTVAVTGYSTPGSTGGIDMGYSSPYFAGSTATSPFLSAVDHHHNNHHHHHHAAAAGPAQLRSTTTHSPALFSKFLDVEHRLPWLSLPGAAGSPALSGSGSNEGPTSMFGRRRSDVGLPSSSSGRSTPGGMDLASSSQQQDGSQQEASFPQPPQPQPQAHSHSYHQQHNHPQHLLGSQELAALSRHNSPMPFNEALPHYLRKKSVDSLHSMERSFSNPGSNSLHPNPHPTTGGPPFMLPLGSTSLTAAAANSAGGGGGGGSAGQQAASPSHLLFAFPGSTTSHPTAATTTSTAATTYARPEMERASSTGVLPMNRSSPRPLPKQQQGHHSHLGITNGGGVSGPSTSLSTNINNNNNNGISAPSTLTTGGPGLAAASFFRTLTPGVHQHHGGTLVGSSSGTSSPSKLGSGLSTFGGHGDNTTTSCSDRDHLPSNKEVHA